MDGRNANVKASELFSGGFFPRFQRHLQLIFSYRIFAQLHLNRDNLSVVA